MQKSKYQSLTIKRKLQIVEAVESLPPGKKKKDMAAEYGIPPSTLSAILKNRESLEASHAVGSFKKSRHLDPTRTDVNEVLFQWFTATRAQSVPISGEVLQSKAEELSKDLGSSEWTCSSSWLSRWKVRHNINYRSICGENSAVDQAVCREWKVNILFPLLQ